jgi:alkylation response protein AidB-like acyl-CoA dehydrogenase
MNSRLEPASEQDRTFIRWLRGNAVALDEATPEARSLLSRAAASGLFRAGVPTAMGGMGDRTWNAVLALAAVAQQSVATAWALGSQRAAIQALMLSSNAGLRDFRLPQLMDGSLYGSTSLASAAHERKGGDTLPLVGNDTGRGWRLNGQLASAANLPNDLFALVVPVSLAGAADYSVLLLTSEHDGLRTRPIDMDGLRGAFPVSLELKQVHFREDELLHADGSAFMQRLRPVLFAFQSAIAIGLTEAALYSVACKQCGGTIEAEMHGIRTDSDYAVAALKQLVDPAPSEARLETHTALRGRLFDIARRACLLESRVMSDAHLPYEHAQAARRLRDAGLLPYLASTVR